MKILYYPLDLLKQVMLTLQLSFQVGICEGSDSLSEEGQQLRKH